MRRFLATGVIAGLAATIGFAADAKQPGLAVGAKAPPFTLKDQADKEQSLPQLLKKGKVALVFYRSASW